MANGLKIEPTTRAYTLKLIGEEHWRDFLWKTHVTVNRGAQVWGDWLLTLRGGLPASLADDESVLPISDSVVDKELKRRKLAKDRKEELRSELEQARRANLKVMLALSWLSVESPASLVPQSHIVAYATDDEADRQRRVMERFRAMLERLDIEDDDWIVVCEPALTARIRDDAVWVDRSGCFADLQQQFPGLDAKWAVSTLLGLLGGVDDYFAMLDEESGATEPKDFVQKAGGWLSRNWGAGEKSDSTAIADRLLQVASISPSEVVGRLGQDALGAVLKSLGQTPMEDADADKLLKQLKQTIGWKGRPSKGALALAAIAQAQPVTTELWQKTCDKLTEESRDQTAKAQNAAAPPAWMNDWRASMEQRLNMPFISKG